MKVKDIVQFIIAATATGLILYLAGSFGNASFNIKEWAASARGFIVFIWLIVIFIAIPFYHD